VPHRLVYWMLGSLLVVLCGDMAGT
jgi:hypothetical protein